MPFNIVYLQVQMAHSINPRVVLFFLNWNNKPAPGEYIYVGKMKQTHNTIQTEVMGRVKQKKKLLVKHYSPFSSFSR